MSMQKMKVFESSIIIQHHPEFLSDAILVADESLKKTDSLPLEQRNHMTVNNGYDLRTDERIRPLADKIGKLSRIFLEDQGYNLTNYAMIFQEFWPQEFSKNGSGYHEVHVHNNTHVCGFYFLQCSDKTSMPVFHDPRFGKNMIQLPEKNNKEITSASSMFHLKPVPGALIMANSYIPHSYTLDPGLEPFKFIHYTISAVPLWMLQNQMQ